MPNYDISFKVVPWSRAKALAKQGQAFAILPPYYHAHDWLTKSKPHRSYLWPYSQPIFAQTDVKVMVIATNYGHLAYTDINSKQTFPFKKDFSIQFDIERYQLKKKRKNERHHQ